MTPVLALVSFVVAFPAQDAVKPPDRGGEGAFRQVLKSLGTARNLRIIVSRQSIVDPKWDAPEEAATELRYKAPGVFRAYQTGSFGDALLAVSDGTTMLLDELQETEVTLENAVAGFMESNASLGPRRLGSVVFSLLDGEAAIDKVVEREAPLTASTRGSETTFEFRMPSAGPVKVVAALDNGNWTIVMTELGQGVETEGSRFSRRAQVVRDTVVEFVRGVKFGKSEFDTTPPAGITVRDLRSAKSG